MKYTTLPVAARASGSERVATCCALPLLRCCYVRAVTVNCLLSAICCDIPVRLRPRFFLVSLVFAQNDSGQLKKVYNFRAIAHFAILCTQKPEAKPNCDLTILYFITCLTSFQKYPQLTHNKSFDNISVALLLGFGLIFPVISVYYQQLMGLPKQSFLDL
ncbi:MAG: hypothetical protein ACRD3T_17600 [Terriglobia bacterium]